MLPFHPYADLFPLIEGEDFDALVADVAANDVRERIIIWDGQILDGRNRYRAAIEAGLIEEEDGAGRTKYFARFLPEIDGDPLTFVLSKNLHRRHLTDGQRASIGGKIATLRKGRPGQNPPIGGISAEQAAATLRVAPRQIERARVVHEQGIHELREMLDRGEIAVSKAEHIARLNAEEQHRHLPNGARSIMGSRVEPADSLDFSPTPPWATRALIERVLPQLGARSDIRRQTAWEPACGEGHMAEVMAEYFRTVHASDIHEYGYGAVSDFLTTDAPLGFKPDWIITNPPFKEKAEAFTLRALDCAKVGVAIFARLQWLETIGRYERLFRDQPPSLIAFFCERVNLCMGRWEPDGGTATAYIWLVWIKGHAPRAPFWIPPGCQDSLTRPDDAERFTAHPVVKAEHVVCDETIDPTTGEILSPESDAGFPGSRVGQEPAVGSDPPCAPAAGSPMGAA